MMIAREYQKKKQPVNDLCEKPNYINATIRVVSKAGTITFRNVSVTDLCELRLTMGMRALLLRAVERCKNGEGSFDVTDSVG